MRKALSGAASQLASPFDEPCGPFLATLSGEFTLHFPNHATDTLSTCVNVRCAGDNLCRILVSLVRRSVVDCVGCWSLHERAICQECALAPCAHPTASCGMVPDSVSDTSHPCLASRSQTLSAKHAVPHDHLVTQLASTMTNSVQPNNNKRQPPTPAL